MASSQVRAGFLRLVQLAMTPHRARAMMTPVQDQASASTCSGEAAPPARVSVVWLIPCQ